MSYHLSKLNKGLVGHWTMSQDSLKSPTIIADKTPYGNDGRIYGATFTTDRHGQPNKAMSFDGVDDYVKVSSLPATYEEVTVSSWVKYGANPDSFNGMIFWKGDFELNLYSRGVTADYIRFAANGVQSTIPLSHPSLDWSEWIHLLGTYDGSIIKIYLNGTLIDDNFGTGIVDTSGLVPGIGGRASGDLAWNGQISDVRIYNRALSAEEVEQLYKGYDMRNGLVGHWPLNEGQGTTAYDRSGNGNDGTLIGGPTWTTK